MANATTKSAARKSGIMENSYLAQSAIGEGHAVVHGAAEQEAILPASATASGFAGVSVNGGLAGGTLTAGTDMFDAQWYGRAKCKLKTLLTANRGDLATLNDTTGALKARTLYSISQQVLGVFAQTKTAGSSDDFIEVDLSPHFIEIVRNVFGSFSSAPGAATKYCSAAGTTTGSATNVALAVVPFACTARNFRVAIKTAPGGTDTGIFTVNKSSDQGNNWTATTITCTVTGTAVTGTDTTHSVALTAGDLVSIECVSSAGTLAGITAEFDLT